MMRSPNPPRSHRPIGRPRFSRRSLVRAGAALWLLVGAAAVYPAPRAAAQSFVQPAPYRPFNVESVGINPATTATGSGQFVLGWQLLDNDNDGNYRLEAGWNQVNPASPGAFAYANMQALDICDGVGPGAGAYTFTVPGIASEIVSASASNPGARGNPSDPNSPLNFAAAHMVIPVKPASEQRGIAWNVVIPTIPAIPGSTFGNSNAATYLSCYKYRINAAGLGGEVVPNGNAAATMTPDGQCLMATTIIQNNGTRAARLWIAVYQLKGGMAPQSESNKNGNNRSILGANHPAVRQVALIDMPGNVRFDPSDWNGNVALCVTRNVGDATAAAPLNAWLAIYSKARGVLTTRFRLGYNAGGALTAYKNNDAATVQFARTDSQVSPWLSYSQRVPANMLSNYSEFAGFADANKYGLVLKTGMDGRARLSWLDSTGKAFEEAYSWGDGTPGSAGYRFYLPRYNRPNNPSQKVAYRQQYFVRGDNAEFITATWSSQLAPVLYNFGTPVFGPARTDGLQQVTQPVSLQTVSSDGSMFINRDINRAAGIYTQTAPHATVVRAPIPTERFDGGIKYVPIGFIEGPPPFPNEHLTYPQLTGDVPDSFLSTTYKVGGGTDSTQEYTTETGVSFNTSFNGTFGIVGASLDVNSNWKQSSALKTTRTVTYDKTVEQNASATEVRNPITGAVTGYALKNVGTLLYRKVRLSLYQYYARDESSNLVPGSSAFRMVMANIPGQSGVNAVDSIPFDLDPGTTPLRAGILTSYRESSGGSVWDALAQASLPADDGLSMILQSSWSKTSSSFDNFKIAAGTVSTQTRSNSVAYLAGLSLGAESSFLDLFGVSVSFKMEYGQSFASTETTSVGVNQTVELSSSYSGIPSFTDTPGVTYRRIAYSTFLLAPDGQWLDELIRHLQGNPDGPNANRSILAQLLPGAGVFKITYRIDSDDPNSMPRQ